MSEVREVAVGVKSRADSEDRKVKARGKRVSSLQQKRI